MIRRLAENIALIDKDFAEMGKVHDTRMHLVSEVVEGYKTLLNEYNKVVANAAVITVQKPVDQTIKS